MVKKIIAACLLLSVCAARGQTDWPAFAFWDSFETGDLYSWFSRTFNPPSAAGVNSTDMRHSGSNCFKLSVTSGTAVKTGFMVSPELPATNLFFQFWFLMESNALPGASGVWDMASIAKGGVGNLNTVRVRNVSGQRVMASSKIGNTATVVTPDVWHCVDVMYLPQGGATNTVTWVMSLDGSVVQTSSNSTSIAVGGDEVRLGVLASAPRLAASGSVYFDDVRVYTNAPYAMVTNGAQLLNPDFLGRIGAPVIALLTGDAATDSFLAVMTNSVGMSNVVYSKAGPLGGRVNFPVYLTNLAVADYGLVCTVRDGDGARFGAAYEWSKTYAGDPIVSMNALNYHTSNGVPTILVTTYCEPYNSINTLSNQARVNFLYGGNFDAHGSDWDDFTNYLAIAQTNGFCVLGPIDTPYGQYTNPNPVTIGIVEQFVTNAMVYTNLTGPV